MSFLSFLDADRVCDGRKHKLANYELSVCLYYKCLDLDKTFAVQIPSPIRLTDLDPNIVRFIQTSKYKGVLDALLKEVNGIPLWSTASNEPLVVSCTIDPKARQSVQLVKDWENKCRDAVCRLTDTFEVNEDICVQKEVCIKRATT